MSDADKAAAAADALGKLAREAALGALSRRFVAAMALMHGIAAATLGVALGLSGFQHRPTSPAQAILAWVPGWPFTFATLFISTGVAIVIARGMSHDHLRLSTYAFAGQAFTYALYSALLIAGTVTTPGAFLGGQVVYVAMAALSVLHAMYSRQARLI